MPGHDRRCWPMNLRRCLYGFASRRRIGLCYRAVRESGPVGDRSHSSALFPVYGFMHNPNEVCIAPMKQLPDAPVEKALIRP